MFGGGGEANMKITVLFRQCRQRAPLNRRCLCARLYGVMFQTTFSVILRVILDSRLQMGKDIGIYSLILYVETIVLS